MAVSVTAIHCLQRKKISVDAQRRKGVSMELSDVERMRVRLHTGGSVQVVGDPVDA